jgi:hypothetical protein
LLADLVRQSYLRHAVKEFSDFTVTPQPESPAHISCAGQPDLDSFLVLAAKD